jgi:LPS export ABC transporter permease LptG/LPS export ABC transporter permease LptF
MRGSRRISLYVLRELTTPTLLALFLYTFVLLMNHFFVVAEKALSKNLGWDLTIRLFVMAIPNLLVLAIPMAVLLGCLIGIGRLSADHEWVALQGAGQGPWRLLKPLLLFGLLASMATTLIYGELAPRANYVMRNLRGELLFASNMASDLKPRVFYSDLPNVVLFVDDIRAGSQGTLDGVLLVQTYPDRPTTDLYLAREGDLYPAPDQSGAVIVDLVDGVSHHYRPDDPEVYFYSSFEFIRRRIETPDYVRSFLEAPEKVVQDLSPAELWQELEAAKRERREVAAIARTEADLFIADSRVRRAKIEMHQRIALPLASFVFALLALPLGITRVRSGKGAGFALSLLVILIYWVAFTLARDQALRGRIPAELGPWMGNLVILPWAAFGLWRLRRPASRRGWIAGLFRGFGGGLRALGRAPAVRAAAAIAPPVVRPAEENGELEGATLSTEMTDLGGTTTRFVGRLDQYVGVYYLRMVLFAVLSAYLIYGLVETKTLVDYLLRNQQPFSLLISYFKYFVPGVLHLMLPISCLIGAVVTVTLLARTGELTAIKAVGVSMRRATVAVLLLTVAMGVLLFVVQDRLAPVSNRKAQEIKDHILGRAPRTYGLPVSGLWAFGPESRRLYHCRLYDPDREDIQGLSVLTLDRDGPTIVDHRFAERARWQDGRGEWELESGWYLEFGEEGSGSVLDVHEGLVSVPLDPPERFTRKELRLTRSLDSLQEQMSLGELDRQIDSLRGSGYDTTQLQVAYHGKLAQAVAPLVMVLLGLPFAFKVGKRGSLYGIGVALILVLVYWAAYAMFNALGLEAILPATVAAWAPNVLFGLFGTYLLLYVRT